MESSLEEAPKEKVQRVEIWGSWGPFVAPDRVSTHYSSLKFSDLIRISFVRNFLLENRFSEEFY